MSVAGWIMGLVAAVVPGFGAPEVPVFNGYLEADYIYVAPLTAGRIVSLAADEGDQVQDGQVLVTLEDETQKAALQAAEAGVAQAEANLDNLSTGGRADEVAVIAASLHKAEADRDLAASNFARTQTLARQGQVSSAKVDQDSTTLEAAKAQVEQLKAQLNVAQLPARDAQRLAAEAALAMARAGADGARIGLADRILRAPVTGILDRRFYQVGEVAGSGAPVLSIFQPGKIKVIFYVPEAARAGFALGLVMHLACDGCPTGITARVTRMATEPQYTPPILYSRDERGRLVFRAEAQVSDAGGLLPGQPVTLWR
ncbi:MAG: HlyD family efflux transporter periplasmic adaptor subunit [bacterium]